MRNGYWVIRTYKAGSVGEKTKFWVEGVRRPKSTVRIRADIRKQEQNEASAEKQVARLINANFKKGDILLGLDYSEAGMNDLLTRVRNEWSEPGDEAEEMERIRQAAEKELRLFLRRVRRDMEKAGLPFKYLAFTSDMDGETGEAVRVHHHLIIKAEALPVCDRKWGLGDIHSSTLSGQPDYTPIATYFIKQIRHIPDAKKYIPSRNLVRPEPKDRISMSGAEIKPPRGSVLLHRGEYKPGRPQYIRYVLPPEDMPPGNE